MSMDRSLKSARALARHRNVLSRAERITRLSDEDHWHEGDSVLGLPKVSNRSAGVGKKKKKVKEEGEGEAAAAKPAK
jgi:small basic protein (TIGR04137 family)